MLKLYILKDKFLKFLLIYLSNKILVYKKVKII